MDTLKDLGAKVTKSIQKNSEESVLEGSDYKIEISIDIDKWIGLDFFLRSEKSKTQLYYSINTDLYNLSLPKYQWFVEEILESINEFIDNLIEGKIMVNISSKRYSMFFPEQGKIKLVKHSWLGTTTSVYNDIGKIKNIEKFHPLTLV